MFVFSADFQQTLQLAKAGNVNAQLHVAFLYYQESNYAASVKWYQEAIKSGNPRAYHSLGYIYLNGLGVKKDVTKAKQLILIAAKKNYIKAQSDLGAIYYQGFGNKPDYVRAKYWFKKAAASGDMLAQYYMGKLYEHGYAVKRNLTTAISYYEKSAEKGFSLAMVELAKIYLYKKKEPKLAEKWANQAISYGNSDGQKILDSIQEVS